MPSDLDLRLREANAALTSDEGPFRVGSFDRDGITLPIIATAPATLPDYYAYFCTVHGDATFIVDGDHRLSRPEDIARLEQAVSRALAG